ncbi:MAG: hydantoinase B/oxoprolinase family protein [Planctomycetaceae bacterium]|nr:hydantoinase B/oxoprolinase family protein [Planctomycetaceae bacterium]
MTHDDRTSAGNARWLVALDTGGTFTDVVARSPMAEIVRAKIPSDGSILARVVRHLVVAHEGVDRPPRHVSHVDVEFAAGLVLPPGFLEGWALDEGEAADERPARVLAHETRRGATVASIVLDRMATSTIGLPLRLRQREHHVDAPRLGLHIVTGTPIATPLPPIEIRLSTTRGTNALLQSRGARVGALVSDGLRGIVEIGDQTREDLFARVPRRSTRLAHAVESLPERSLAGGAVECAASVDAILDKVAALRRSGCETIVVSLAHALDNDREQAIAAAVRGSGAPAIAARDVAAHPRLLTRTETACVHAQIAPILSEFVADATHSASDARSFVFTSAGVLQRAERLLARDTLFSGPAGGARSIVAVARRHGIERAVGFDMGGTSSDVSRVSEGEVALRAESRIGRRTVAAPSVAVDSVAAGGGSICRVRDGAFEVGPESAGANPGPACYGRDGPAAITDVNLLAGRIAIDAGALALDRSRAEVAIDALAEARGATREDAIEALLDIANARMALAIETLCVRDGVDPRDHALVAFGGAGGQHACAIADRLGVERIVFPRFAGFLCAQGVFDARPARFATVPVLRTLEACAPDLERLAALARDEAISELADDGVASPGEAPAAATAEAEDRTLVTITAALRLVGQESTIVVPFAGTCVDIDAMRERFIRRFLELYGYQPPARAIEVVSLECRALARSRAPSVTHAIATPRDARPGSPTAAARIYSEGMWSEAVTITREALQPGDRIEGPAIVTDAGETVVIDRSWRATVDPSGDLVAGRARPASSRASAAEQELFAARLEAIALSMGHLLERTALSPNIRDRLDFSCAVLDADGTLIQNAPHLPVHLGALGVCARLVRDALSSRGTPLAEGDIAVTNHPAFGGSHLPDVTTVAPVVIDGRTVAYVAVRAHHAEIGGTRPGSFPPDAASLAEEGVVLAPFLAVHGGRFDRDAAHARFADAPHPSRNPAENLADLEAQIAATRHGVARIAALARELGDAFAARCEGELARADRALRRAVARLATAGKSRTSRVAERLLDDGSPIRVSIETCDDPERTTCLRISFAGSAAVHPRNFNAPLAVTRAATLYALRLLIDEPVPMNEGLLRAVELDVPTGMLNPPFAADPRACPPVVAGNVETSQSVVAALLDALGIAAESQSTMNNTLFGNERSTIYETLGGGAGAGPGLEGASAVHVHMSNTRLTDIDVLERRAPVVIRRFEVRVGSGGAIDGHGANDARGGDGLVRSYEFREPVSLSFFGSRRKFAPRGVGATSSGSDTSGVDGARGLQRARIAGITHVFNDAVLSLDLAAGDLFTVETPGGGGWRGPR